MYTLKFLNECWDLGNTKIFDIHKINSLFSFYKRNVQRQNDHLKQFPRKWLDFNKFIRSLDNVLTGWITRSWDSREENLNAGQSVHRPLRIISLWIHLQHKCLNKFGKSVIGNRVTHLLHQPQLQTHHQKHSFISLRYYCWLNKQGPNHRLCKENCTPSICNLHVRSNAPPPLLHHAHFLDSFAYVHISFSMSLTKFSKLKLARRHIIYIPWDTIHFC